jgi:hypothetical protein
VSYLHFDEFEAITRLRYEYAFGIDTRDYRLLRSIFLDEILMDFSSYNGRPSARVDAQEWVDGCAELFDGLDATQHTMANPIVDLDRPSGHARQRMTMQAVHFLDGSEFTLGGWYDDHVILTDQGWKLAGVTLHVTWRRGDESIMSKALERTAGS